MDPSEEEVCEPEEEPEPDAEPGKCRPPGAPGQKPRYRRTAQQISEDKVRIAQTKLDAVREAEEKKLANTKSRAQKPSAVSSDKRVTVVSEAASAPATKKPAPQQRREETPSPKQLTHTSRRQTL